MNERELDRAIDAAAAAMMAHEPSRSMSYNVMARVGKAPAPRPIGWIATAAGVVACAAIAVALMSPSPAPVVTSTPSWRSDVVGQPHAPMAPTMTIAQEAAPARRTTAPIARRSVSPAQLPPGDVSAIEPIQTSPIQTEAIAVAAIDVPDLEREAMSIETLSIEPLAIEPLATSND